jgi:hypothetical protein
MERKTVPLAVGAALWLLAVYSLSVFFVDAYRGRPGDSPIVGTVFRDAAPGASWAAWALVVVFTWVTVQVLFRAIRVAREELAAGGITSPERISPGLRARKRAELIKSYRSARHRLSEILPAACALDATQLDNSYVALRALVWVLPVLGFIGTASEMSHSIRGFSDSLRLSPEGTANTAVVIDRMAQVVIPGLASAFAITMLALGASVLGHWWVSSLQAWDRGALERLDRVSIAELDSGTGAPIPRELLEGLIVAMRGLASEVHGLIGKLDIADAGARLGSAAQALEGSAGRLEQAAGALMDAAEEVKSATKGPYHLTLSRGETR